MRNAHRRSKLIVGFRLVFYVSAHLLFRSSIFPWAVSH